MKSETQSSQNIFFQSDVILVTKNGNFRYCAKTSKKYQTTLVNTPIMKIFGNRNRLYRKKTADRRLFITRICADANANTRILPTA